MTKIKNKVNEAREILDDINEMERDYKKTISQLKSKLKKNEDELKEKCSMLDSCELTLKEQDDIICGMRASRKELLDELMSVKLFNDAINNDSIDDVDDDELELFNTLQLKGYDIKKSGNEFYNDDNGDMFFIGSDEKAFLSGFDSAINNKGWSEEKINSLMDLKKTLIKNKTKQHLINLI